MRALKELKPYGIHWFRRDLRIRGNPALEWNRKAHSGRVLGLFTIDPLILSRSDLGWNRFAWFLDNLRVLKEELRSQGGDLLVLEHGPDAAFELILEHLKSAKIPAPSAISFNRDYEPFARDRDARIERKLSDDYGIEVHSARDHLLIEPGELSKDEPGSFYQVYTPFKKKWLKLLATPEIQERIVFQSRALSARPESTRFDFSWSHLLGSKSGTLPAQFADRLDAYRNRASAQVLIPLPEAGFATAFRQLKAFGKKQLAEYETQRDFPAVAGTSRLSVHLKTGALTTAQAVSVLNFEKPTKFLEELIWREFYYHILYHRPRVEQESFLRPYRELQWENNERHFKAWCEGQTGYPIVDAAMRELNTTGWMHNRMRMVVASFLTKDLLIDWKWGERYFMLKLLDGDLAPNNGGWQWAASTGCDPQPYFRIFNPSLQSKRYDARADYMRRYLPELAQAEKHGSAIRWHEPGGPASKGIGYPAPIVDHSVQSRKAIELFKAARKSR